MRRKLEEEHGADIDFYQEEFESQWKNQTKNWLLSWNPSRWTWDTLAADRATTISGEKADNRWRCSSSKPREGDRVFLMRTGNPPKGVVAVGKITRAPYEAEHWEQARADAGEVSDFRITVRGVGALRFDRTIRNWEPVFARAHWLLSGLYPDVRIGDAAGSALLFNMEKLFETVLGLRIRHAWQAQHGGRLSVGLQSPVKDLATAGFQLRPDIAIQSGDETVAILDAKWKHLDLGEANSRVSSGDAYQMNAYASRYRCKRLALVYPASRDCPPGRIAEFVLMTEERPVLDVVAVDVREFAFGSGIPAGIDAIDPYRAELEAKDIDDTDLRSDMKDFGPSCFHSASTVVPNTHAAPRGGVFACGIVWRFGCGDRI